MIFYIPHFLFFSSIRTLHMYMKYKSKIFDLKDVRSLPSLQMRLRSGLKGVHDAWLCGWLWWWRWLLQLFGPRTADQPGAPVLFAHRAWTPIECNMKERPQTESAGTFANKTISLSHWDFFSSDFLGCEINIQLRPPGILRIFKLWRPQT